jgi:hypothetical protein
MDTPYYPDEAERDMDKIMKQLQIVQGSFQVLTSIHILLTKVNALQKGMLNNLKVPTTQEFGQETESMEQLIRKCMDQSASLHAEIDKIKKATLFCSTRIEAPSQTQ